MELFWMIYMMDNFNNLNALVIKLKIKEANFGLFYLKFLNFYVQSNKEIVWQNEKNNLTSKAEHLNERIVELEAELKKAEATAAEQTKEFKKVNFGWYSYNWITRTNFNLAFQDLDYIQKYLLLLTIIHEFIRFHEHD